MMMMMILYLIGVGFSDLYVDQTDVDNGSNWCR